MPVTFLAELFKTLELNVKLSTLGDIITDFSAEEDNLIFSLDSVSDDITISEIINPEQFVNSTTAITSDHRFVYDSQNGNLFYDSDGLGGLEQQFIVNFSDRPNLGNEDFLIA